MGRKAQPSISSGGIGVTQEVGNIGGLGVTGGVGVEISPIGLDVSGDPSNGTVSIAGSAEVPGGLLGLSGGVTLDTNTGEIRGGSIGGEALGLGINLSSEDGDIGVEFTLQIPFTPLELSLGLEFPKERLPTPMPIPIPTPTPTPTPTIINNALENPLSSVPSPTIDPECKYWIKTTRTYYKYWQNGNTISPSNSPFQETPDSYALYATPLFPQNIYPQSASAQYYHYNGAGFVRIFDKSNPSINHIDFSSNHFLTLQLWEPINRTDVSFGRVIISYQKNIPVYSEWQLLMVSKYELKEVCDRPEISFPPFPNPPPRKRNMDQCCCENLRLTRAMYVKLGLTRFPGQLPATIIQEVPKEGEEPAEPPQIPIPDLVSLLDWQFRRDDERWGQWEVQINVKDADVTKEGDQGKQVKFPNLAESIAEIEGQMLSLTTNIDALIAITTKNLVESGLSRQEAIKGYLASKSIIKYMAFKTQEIDVTVPLCFTPGAETIDSLVKESELHLKGLDYTEKETLRDIFLDLLQAAAVIRAVHWQRIDTKKDTKSQLLGLLKGSVDLANSIKNPTKPTDDSGEPNPTKNFEDFLDSAEDGFRNATGITDMQNPYGKTPDRRPRIRQIGDNIAQAGKDN
ncbi:hypothetical protein [Microcoleus sp. Pol12B5]|uniref:hypothetical protein n=1 Tax=Microcoleus sp. Pol12B5 TaxID=3055396 RepID=UPI002FD13618